MPRALNDRRPGTGELLVAQVSSRMHLAKLVE
jgi:hypothetical protein